MARRGFAGDTTHRLPKGKIEPYRLWFEYLKLALRCGGTEIDKKRYAEWGDVSGADFDSWWDSHWRQLFAVAAPTRILTNREDCAEALNDPTVVVVRISLAEPKKRRIRDIDDALAGLKLTSQDRLAAKQKPLFEVASKRNINFKTLRGMLRFRELAEDHQHDIEATAIAYFKWSQAWNRKVREKNWKRPLVYEPTFLRRFVEEIEEKNSHWQSQLAYNTGEYNNLRSQAQRFVRKSNTILSNVRKGLFPGRF